MPAAPSLTTTIVAGTTTGHASDHVVINGVINGIYLASIGTTRTTAFTLVQANSGEFIPVNSASTVAVTVPVLAVGTSIEIQRQGAGAVTLTASGVTFEYAAGSTPTPRAQGSSISLLWKTATLVYVSGDLT